MLVANLGWDLQAASEGRFIIGLGSQIKPHITKRFSMPWSSPAARCAVSSRYGRSGTAGRPASHCAAAVLHAHADDPFFSPPAEARWLRAAEVFLAGVGTGMTETAGEVADGFICHGFTTERYLREVTLPALAAGRERAGMTMEGFEIVGPSFVVTGTTDAEMAAAAAGTRQQIAFYGSTPAYLPVLELHGWEDLHKELNALSKSGKWVEMGNLITDDILDTFAVVGAPEAIAPELHRRYGDVIQRISFYAPYDSDPDRWGPVLESLKSAS